MNLDRVAVNDGGRANYIQSLSAFRHDRNDGGQAAGESYDAKTEHGSGWGNRSGMSTERRPGAAMSAVNVGQARRRPGCGKCINDAMTSVPTDIEVYRAANQLVKQHGDAARLVAAQRAIELMEKGDLDGKRACVRILRA